MIWSKLKKRIEERFSDSLAGRLELRSTRYRNGLEEYYHDQKIWVTFDKETLVEFSDSQFRHKKNKETQDLWDSREAPGKENKSDYWDAVVKTRIDAEASLKEKGELMPYDVSADLHKYLNLSIDEALVAESAVIRAFAVVDKRVGKRRLKNIDVSSENKLVNILFNIRCEAEGVSPDKSKQQGPTAGAR